MDLLRHTFQQRFEDVTKLGKLGMWITLPVNRNSRKGGLLDESINRLLCPCDPARLFHGGAAIYALASDCTPPTVATVGYNLSILTRG